MSATDDLPEFTRARLRRETRTLLYELAGILEDLDEWYERLDSLFRNGELPDVD